MGFRIAEPDGDPGVKWDTANAPIAEEAVEADGLAPDALAPDPDTLAPDALAASKADALLELGDEIAELAAHLHAGTHRLLVLIAEFDARGGWKAGGHRSCARWLHYRTGFDLGACREKVRAARVLTGLPETSAAMARGELSFAKVRALTRVATQENEADLLPFALQGTARQVERLVRSWKHLSRCDEAEQERLRHESRTLTIVPAEDGMYEMRGRLDPEVGALLMRAIEAASDALYRRGKEAESDGHRVEVDGRRPHLPRADREVTPTQRRADALGLLAERALHAGFDLGSAPVSGARADRYQVLLHVETDTLQADAEPGRSHLEDGTRVSAETSRRLACDAAVVRVRTSATGDVLDVGRRTRTIPPAIRRALDVRDGGCRFPGCGVRFTEAHHMQHWADGGETKIDNLLLLCRFHHRLVHEEGWRVQWPSGCGPEFESPGGLTIRRATDPPGARSPDPIAALIRENERAGALPTWRTAAAMWKREADVDLGVATRAFEALAESSSSEGQDVSAETRPGAG